MTEVTDRFGIRYPTQGEVVTLTHFANLAADVDAALTALTTRRNLTLKRPTARVSGPNGGAGATTVPAGTTTVLALGGGTGSIIWWDTDSMKAAGVNDRLTVKTAGVYMVNASIMNSFTNATTLDSFELQLNIAGSTPKVVSHRQNSQNMNNPGPWTVSTVWRFAVNDYVQVRAFFAGTGSLMPVGVTLEMRLVCLL